MSDKKSIIQDKLELLLQKGVYHIIVINKLGRAELVFSRNKIALSKEKLDIFFMGFRLHHSLLEDFNDEFGPVRCFVIHRDNVKLVSVPFDLYNILLIMKNDTDHEFFINKIKEIEKSNPNTSEPE